MAPIDFLVYDHGSVWNIVARSKAAKEFAVKNLDVEGWMGSPINFTTDHRPAQELCARLQDEGWFVYFGGGLHS